MGNFGIYATYQAWWPRKRSHLVQRKTVELLPCMESLFRTVYWQVLHSAITAWPDRGETRLLEYSTLNRAVARLLEETDSRYFQNRQIGSD